MDQRPNVSLENSAKQPKLLALIALVIAFTLPFILVKSFPHKQKTSYGKKQHQLPSPELEDIPSIKPSDVSKQNPVVPTPVLTILKPKPQASVTKQPPAKPQTSVTSTQPSNLRSTQPITATKPTTPATLIHTAATTEQENEWKIIKTRSGDSLAAVFKRLDLKPKILQTILRDNSHPKALSRLKPNQQLEFLIKKKTLEKMIVPFTKTQYLVIYREGQHYKSKINSHKMDSHNHYVTATVRGSLYSTAKHHNVPYKVMQQMTEIFAWDINFAKDVRTGDQFTIIYKTFYIGDKLVETGEIVAVNYKNRGKTFQAVLHTNRAGHSNYFNPQGTSLRKAFNRYPLRFSHISSTFSLARNHPILRYKRPHKGVDLAAPIGTPILATGDGHIEVIGRQSGYGNMIKIKHNKTYSTIYGHMLKFQKGLSKGTYVKRGQVIGYVGQTGLATGPHCHYEFHSNRQPKNPTTVDLPRSDPISARELAAFKANTNTLLAQLKLFEAGRLINTNKRDTKIG